MNAVPQSSRSVPQIMIVAGERSGDIYGAGLARALQARLPGLEVFGCGGEAMRQAAVDTVVDSHQIAIAGITEVIHGNSPRLSRFPPTPHGSGPPPTPACHPDRFSGFQPTPGAASSRSDEFRWFTS